MLAASIFHFGTYSIAEAKAHMAKAGLPMRLDSVACSAINGARMSEFSLADLERIVAERGRSGDSGSWTAKLFAGGMDKAAKKLGEEAVETVIAAVGGDEKALVSESADLLYHWLVVLALAGVPLSEVIAELERRTAQSGIAEKASRPTRAERG